MKNNQVRLSGYNFMIIYNGIEYEISTDVCLDIYLFDGSITPDPSENSHTYIEIKDFVEEQFSNGNAIGLD